MLFAYAAKYRIVYCLFMQSCGQFSWVSQLLGRRNLKTVLLIKSDSMVLVMFLRDGCAQSHACFPLVRSIEDYKKGVSLRVQLVLRESNQITDELTKFGHSLDENFKILSLFVCFCITSSQRMLRQLCFLSIFSACLRVFPFSLTTKKLNIDSVYVIFSKKKKNL